VDDAAAAPAVTLRLLRGVMVGGQRIEPGELQRIAAVFAALRGLPLEEVIARTGANARRVLPALAALSPQGRSA
jgi:Tat protein secretion system quality control protein TatD with DNase activity